MSRTSNAALSARVDTERALADPFPSPAATPARGPSRLAPAAVQARPQAPAAAKKRPANRVLLLAFLTSIALAVAILVALHGWAYYSTPLGVRGYTPQHKTLQPAGTVGLALGITGTVLMALMQVYSLRKRVKRLSHLGALPLWLDFHIFCGIVGPVMITFHTSFKFNGLVSVAYWSMILVFLSGFVGRYLYVRIPKSIRGQELSVAQAEERAAELRAELLALRPPQHLVDEVEAFEKRVVPQPGGKRGMSSMPFGEEYIKVSLWRLRRRIRHDFAGVKTLHDAVALIAERAVLLRRLAYLKRTKRLFELWHIFHRPLAYVMLLVVIIHVATAVYFGYAFGRI